MSRRTIGGVLNLPYSSAEIASDKQQQQQQLQPAGYGLQVLPEAALAGPACILVGWQRVAADASARPTVKSHTGEQSDSHNLAGHPQVRLNVTLAVIDPCTSLGQGDADGRPRPL